MSQEQLTTTQAADLIGCCRNHVKKLLRDGLLEGHQIGNRWRTTLAAVQRFLESRKLGQGAA